MRIPTLIALTVLALWLPVGGARAAAPATEVLAVFEPVLVSIDEILSDPQATPEEKRALIEHDLGIWVDNATMAQAALGPRAEEFTAAELVAFASEFERYFQHFYISRISLRDEKARKGVEARYDAQTGTVNVTVPGAAAIGFVRRPGPRDVDVRLRFRQRYGDWRIVHVTIGCVDVTKLSGDQFESLLRSETPEALIARLRDRNEQLEARNPLSRK